MNKENGKTKTPKITIDDLAVMMKAGFDMQEKKMKAGFKEQEKRTDDKIDDLAIMVKKGFDEVSQKVDTLEDKMNKKFDEVDKRLVVVHGKLDHTNARIDYLTRDVKEIKNQMTPKIEIEDLSERVKYIEEKIGIESGK